MTRVYLLHTLTECISVSTGTTTSGPAGQLKTSSVSARWVDDGNIVQLVKGFKSWERLVTRKQKQDDIGSGKTSIYKEVRKEEEEGELILINRSLRHFCLH